MSSYSTYFNGEWTNVYDLDDCIRAIQCRNSDNEKRIKYLEEENRKLKENHYKDNEMQKMKKNLEEMREEYYRGFPISEKEQNAIEKWKKKHDEEVHGLDSFDKRLKAGGCIGGRYKYEFVPTSIFTGGYIKCCLCDKKFCFTDY